MATFFEQTRQQWGDLLSNFGDRVLQPLSRPTAIFYLLFAVAVIGGVGLWATYLLTFVDQASPRELVLGIVTYALAIVATSIGDLMLDRDAGPGLRYLLFGVAIVALIACGVFTYWWVWCLKEGDPVSPQNLLMCVAPVWFTWWLVNGVDQRFLMPPTPKAALGGDAGQELT
jgi:hypothetical protein